jgi:hypothetical protein
VANRLAQKPLLLTAFCWLTFNLAGQWSQSLQSLLASLSRHADL